MRVRTAAVLLAMLALASAGAATASAGAAKARSSTCTGAHAKPSKTARRVIVRSVLCLINRERTKRGLSALRHQDAQRRAAARHNRLMIRTKCFAHVCPGEAGLVTRLIQARYLPCDCRWGVAENIAWGTQRLSQPGSIVRRWMRSPGHRHNILDPAFRHIGIAVHEGTPAAGVSGGATYTTDFGYRR